MNPLLIRFRLFLPVFLMLTGLALIAGSVRAETLTYPDLVQRLFDLEHLSIPPPVGEQGANATSYDRASQYDAATDKYIHWDANADGSGIIRKEGDQEVLAEIAGPGCIWRTWSATPKNGHVKIYLDGDTTPAVNLPFSGYFDGKNAPFNQPNIVYRTKANGFDNYTPISFQKSCKIVADPGWGNYYHFNYTKFAPGTIVPTFKLPLSDGDTAALAKANQIFGQCGTDPAGDRPGQKTETPSVTIPAHSRGTVIDLAGPQTITGLRLKFDYPANLEQQRILFHQIALRITWDGQKKPAVWAPIGDFFGNSAGAAPHRNLPAGMTEDGTWYSYWYMPFATHATLAIDNDSDQPVTMNWEVVHAPLDQPADALLRFHAKWHRDAFLPERKDRWPDWTMLTTQGKGRFVGTQLHVWNARDGWWGEGDEKFFVDGEKFPSSYGTGSEDYFGYAWGTATVFVQALHSQPFVDKNGLGHIVVNRWHIPDNIPFQTSFEGDLEKYFKNERPTLFADTAFWYLSSDGTDPYDPVPVADRVGFWAWPKVYREPGAIEGEDLKAATRPLHHYGVTPMWGVKPETWSNDAELYWDAASVGERLELNFPVATAGKYQLIARFTNVRVNGIFQMEVDGQKIGQPVDQYGPGMTPGDPITLGTVDLTAGTHVLAAEVVGKNPLSVDYKFRMDYIKLVPAP